MASVLAIFRNFDRATFSPRRLVQRLLVWLGLVIIMILSLPKLTWTKCAGLLVILAAISLVNINNTLPSYVGIHERQETVTDIPKENTPHPPTKGRRRASLYIGSQPRMNEHLVSTGRYNGEKILRLFIQVSGNNTRKQNCNVYSLPPDAKKQVIEEGLMKKSADVTIEEHGWFGDVDAFGVICKAIRIREDESLDDIFLKWRSSLLKSLDAELEGLIWTSTATSSAMHNDTEVVSGG